MKQQTAVINDTSERKTKVSDKDINLPNVHACLSITKVVAIATLTRTGEVCR